MTVRCITNLDKAYIADAFTSKTRTIKELALDYGRSRHTISRVLREFGIIASKPPRVEKPSSLFTAKPTKTESGWLRFVSYKHRFITFMGLA